MSKDSMVFYRSVSEALEELDGEDYKTVMMAIFSYAYDGVIPELESPTNRMAWKFVKPQVDACVRKYEAQVSNGQKGGRPKKTQENPTETQNNPTKPKRNQTKTLNDKCEMINDKCFPINPSSSRAYARGGEMNPDDDYEERHEGEGEVHFKPTVKLGFVSRNG